MQSQELLQSAFDTGLLPAGSSILEMRRNLVIEHADSGEDVPAFGIRVGLPLDECDIATLAGVRCSRETLTVFPAKISPTAVVN